MMVAKGYAICNEDGTFALLYQVDESASLAGIDLGMIPVHQGPQGLVSLAPLKNQTQQL
jgi:hypothetical protein